MCCYTKSTASFMSVARQTWIISKHIRYCWSPGDSIVKIKVWFIQQNNSLVRLKNWLFLFLVYCPADQLHLSPCWFNFTGPILFSFTSMLCHFLYTFVLFTSPPCCALLSFGFLIGLNNTVACHHCYVSSLSF